MSDLILWHNPRCSKSRQTLALLHEKGHKPHVRLYLQDAPDASEIENAVKRLGLASARDLMRVKEAEYAEMGLKNVEDEKALIAAMAKTPRLIERPIAFKGGKAAIGRPPENVLKLL